MQNQTITVSSPSENVSKILETKKFPVFKPFQISKASQEELRKNKNEFLQAIQDQLCRLDPSSKRPMLEDTPAPRQRNEPESASSSNHIAQNTPSISVLSDHLSKQPSSKHEIARLNWSQPSSSKSLIPSHNDMDLTPPKLVQSKYK